MVISVNENLAVSGCFCMRLNAIQKEARSALPQSLRDSPLREGAINCLPP